MSDTERIGDDETTECFHCGEEVDVTEPGHYKSVSDQFWHEDCFAEYCYERRSLVATPEGSFKIKPVVIKEIENGKEKIIDSFWRADCPVCSRTHQSEEQTEELRPDFIDQVTDCCDTEWLPPADWIENCDICGDDHRESEGCTPLAWREPFPSGEDHRYDCTECDWSGEADEFDNVRGECPDCGTAAVKAVPVATDGGTVKDGSEHIDWPAEFERTDPSDRKEYPGGFRVTRSTAFGNVLDELATWQGVTDVQLDSGAEHQKQNPNKPYANASYEDPGVVVRFTKEGEQMAAACDRWDNPRDNAQDLYHYLHETRMQEQRGTVTAESEYEKLRLPSGDEEAVAASPPAHAVLGVDRDADRNEVMDAYRTLLKQDHPDHGGSEQAFKRLQEAKEAMLNE